MYFAGERYVMTFLNVLNFGDQGKCSNQAMNKNTAFTILLFRSLVLLLCFYTLRH